MADIACYLYNPDQIVSKSVKLIAQTDVTQYRRRKSCGKVTTDKNWINLKAYFTQEMKGCRRQQNLILGAIFPKHLQ